MVNFGRGSELWSILYFEKFTVFLGENKLEENSWKGKRSLFLKKFFVLFYIQLHEISGDKRERFGQLGVTASKLCSRFEWGRNEETHLK